MTPLTLFARALAMIGIFFITTAVFAFMGIPMLALAAILSVVGFHVSE